jgi:hypothetical protein
LVTGTNALSVIVPRCTSYFEQGGMQADVDEKLRHYGFLAGLYRASAVQIRFEPSGRTLQGLVETANSVNSAKQVVVYFPHGVCCPVMPPGFHPEGLYRLRKNRFWLNDHTRCGKNCGRKYGM